MTLTHDFEHGYEAVKPSHIPHDALDLLLDRWIGEVKRADGDVVSVQEDNRIPLTDRGVPGGGAVVEWLPDMAVVSDGGEERMRRSEDEGVIGKGWAK